MSFLSRLFGIASGEQSKAKDNEQSTIQVPRTEPGWNVNAEEYFRKELRPQAGTEVAGLVHFAG